MKNVSKVIIFDENFQLLHQDLKNPDNTAETLRSVF